MFSLHFKEEQIAELVPGLQLIAKVRGFAICEDGLAVQVKHTDRLSISASNQIYEITYETKTDFFRAVSMLIGMLEQGKENFSIEEKSALDMCGVMIDCSRNAVPRPDKVVELFARVAMMGINCVMLYTEDTYEVDGYPYFGYLRGRYSKEELRQLDATAQTLGIEMIPCIQTLAHLKAALRWGYASDIKDTDDILLIGEPKTYEFIESMFRSLRSCCSSKRIHIGMDEAMDVGLGTYLKKNGYCNRHELILKHLDKVCELAAKYDFKPMMWSDMFFRIHSVRNKYLDPAVTLSPTLADTLPANLSMVFWNYDGRTEALYSEMFDKHKPMDRELIFAGGVWNWFGLAPHYQQTFRASFPALNACRKNNIRKLFATIWGDDGGEINIFATLLGIQLFAEYNYYETIDMAHLKEHFALCTGLSSDAFLAIALDDLPDEITFGHNLPLSRPILYQDVLCGLFDKNLSCFDFESEYDKMLANLEALAPQKDMEFLFDHYRALAKVLKRKVHMGVKIRKAYDSNDKETLSALADELGLLADEYQAFHEQAYLCWHTVNKPFGFDVYERRLGGTLLRIQTAQRKIRDYLSGNITTIEELNEELLWYGDESSENFPAAVQSYQKIYGVSTS